MPLYSSLKQTETSQLFTTKTTKLNLFRMSNLRNRDKPIVYDNNCINTMQVETDETYTTDEYIKM